MELAGRQDPAIRVSIATTTMDRFEHLTRTLPQNLMDNAGRQECEFIVLNYGCPDPRTEPWIQQNFQNEIDTGRLVYAHAPDVRFYNRAHSNNLAFNLASGDIFCCVDADNYTGWGFADYVAVRLRKRRAFLRGPLDGRGLGGRMAIWRDDWEGVGGFDETLRGWGAEDTDLADRLRRSGARQFTLWRERFCQTITHGDELRFLHQEEDSQLALQRNFDLVIEGRTEHRIRARRSGGQGRVQVNFDRWLEF
jgi:hypothetical protein